MGKGLFLLLPPISDHVIIHKGGNSCTIFAERLVLGSIRKLNKTILPTEFSGEFEWVATKVNKPQPFLSIVGFAQL